MRAVSYLLVVGLIYGTAPSAHAALPAIAVFDVQDTRDIPLSASELEETSRYLAAMLSEGGVFRIVPRTELRTALSAQKAESYNACFAEACQIEIGRALAAEKSLGTRITQLGSGCVLTAKIYDLRSEVTEQTASVRGACDTDHVLQSLEDLVAQLRAKSPSGAPPVAKERSREQGTALGQIRAELENVAQKRGLDLFDLGVFEETKHDMERYNAAVAASSVGDARERASRVIAAIPRVKFTQQIAASKLKGLEHVLELAERSLTPERFAAYSAVFEELSAQLKPGLEPADYEAIALRAREYKGRYNDDVRTDRSSTRRRGRR